MIHQTKLTDILNPKQFKNCESRGGGTHEIFGRGCATIKSLYRPFLEFLKKKLDPSRNFCA